MIPTVTVPRIPPVTSSTASRAEAAAASVVRAGATRAGPASVSATRRVVRSNSAARPDGPRQVRMPAHAGEADRHCPVPGRSTVRRRVQPTLR